MFASGNSLSKICDILTREGVPTPSMHKNMNIGQKNHHYGVWATRTVGDILKNPTYIGNLAQCKQKKLNYKSKKRVHNKKQDWIIKENAVPKIVSEDLFNLVQDMFKSNKNRGKRSGMTNNLLLKGLIFCKECGHTIGFRVQNQKTQKYGLVTRIYGNCNYWSKRKKQEVCTPHSVKYNVIEDVVLDSIRKIYNKYLDAKKIENILKNSDRLKKKQEKIKYEIIRTENNIKNINKKMDACYNDKLEENITLDMFKRTYNNLILEIKKCENQKKEYIRHLNNIQADGQTNNNYVEKIKDFLEMKSPSRALITSLIDRIEVGEDKTIDIYYKFKLF